MVTNQKAKDYTFSDEPLWFRILWILSSGTYKSYGTDVIYVTKKGKARSINRQETDESIQKQIKWSLRYMARPKNRNVNTMYSFIEDGKRKEDKFKTWYKLQEIQKIAFPDYFGPAGIKAKLACRKGVRKALINAGGVDFIKEQPDESDFRYIQISIDDGALKEWLNNLFSYHLSNEITESFYFESPTPIKDDIFKMVEVHPRVILRYAICDWKAPQFPSKDYLAKKIFGFVAMKLIREWKWLSLKEDLRAKKVPNIEGWKYR